MLIAAQEDFEAFFQTNSKSDFFENWHTKYISSGDFGDDHIKLWDHINSMQL